MAPLFSTFVTKMKAIKHINKTLKIGYSISPCPIVLKYTSERTLYKENNLIYLTVQEIESPRLGVSFINLTI